MNNKKLPQLFIFCALECEAKPLLNFYQLKKQTQYQAFSIYKNDNIILTVSGVGKCVMAGAVTYTLALFINTSAPILINIGIAGHQTKAIGKLVLVSKITDQQTGKKLYPQLLAIDKPVSCQIKTVSDPETKYSADCLYDMEASAFYEMAVKFSSCELIHCLKIVSDNQQSSTRNINAQMVKKWITDQLQEIDELIKELLALRYSIAAIEVDQYESAINKWHFTVTGQIKLKALLLRWHVLTGKNWLNIDEIEFTHSKQVLKKLEADVNSVEIHL